MLKSWSSVALVALFVVCGPSDSHTLGGGAGEPVGDGGSRGDGGESGGAAGGGGEGGSCACSDGCTVPRLARGLVPRSARETWRATVRQRRRGGASSSRRAGERASALTKTDPLVLTKTDPPWAVPSRPATRVLRPRRRHPLPIDRPSTAPCPGRRAQRRARERAEPPGARPAALRLRSDARATFVPSSWGSARR
jgi:hypothetical protein